VVDERIGQLVQGAYRIERLLGRGGMGAVYEARNVSSGERVAIKIIAAEHAGDASVVSRFAREAKAASAVESPHIARVLDTGSHEGLPFLVMELLVGEDLGARLRRTRRLSVDETVHVVSQILEGLVGAHAAGIVHRDLKPDNVLLVERGADRAFVKIVDFGTSKIRPHLGKTTPLSITRSGVAMGTPLYMSPEQAAARADVDERSDLYSVGALAFECLTGRPPHVGESDDDVVAALCTRDAPPVRSSAPETPERLAAVVDKALARDREARFPTARKMLEALAEAARSSSAPPIAAAAPVDRMSPAPPRSGGGGAARSTRPRAPVSAGTWVAAFGAALCGVATTAWVASRMRESASSHAAPSLYAASANRVASTALPDGSSTSPKDAAVAAAPPAGSAESASGSATRP
jgi:serine/threonine-protein kinase